MTTAAPPSLRFGPGRVSAGVSHCLPSDRTHPAVQRGLCTHHLFTATSNQHPHRIHEPIATSSQILHRRKSRRTISSKCNVRTQKPGLPETWGRRRWAVQLGPHPRRVRADADPKTGEPPKEQGTGGENGDTHLLRARCCPWHAFRLNLSLSPGLGFVLPLPLYKVVVGHGERAGGAGIEARKGSNPC
ncbi:hypothetical protein DPEC_G00308790 [Dallia pectoralis]|uniref:Uncharacterized protein n=1 Tax=Dallia pectoralis TaxID=75939 RepID=A0ACC2FEW9_DALPE|nr:hypothetical protein DPEC_G00308790 [Dallia pectoralis]